MTKKVIFSKNRFKQMGYLKRDLGRIESKLGLDFSVLRAILGSNREKTNEISNYFGSYSNKRTTALNGRRSMETILSTT